MDSNYLIPASQEAQNSSLSNEENKILRKPKAEKH